ncbi:tetratricopeptide repeat protein [Aequorivita flava]|uniref:Tetratricopeptide repeat protein n=1 Tax=Aequorivita flava TaxID=3114371 RepID=A0AB35YVR0_9FLAO
MQIKVYYKWMRFSPFGGNAAGRGGLYLLFILLPLFTIAQTNYEQAEEYFKQENFSKAKPIFEYYLKQNPNDKQTREYLGDIAAYGKDWDEALLYYENLVKEEESNANYHFKYGGALGMKALSVSRLRAVTYIGEIKHHLERAAKLIPKHIEARWALVEFYIQLPGIIGGSEKKAIEYANELGAISKVDGYLAKGYIAEYSDRPKDAERYYKNAIEVGGSPHTYEKLADLYEKNNQPKEALETTSKALKIHRRNQLNYQIGKIAAQYNLEPEYGIKCLSQYLANYSIKDGVPKDWAYYRLAQIYKNLGKKEIALTWINKALLDRTDFKEAQQEKSLILAM